MADYFCSECNHKEEWLKNKSLPKAMQEPDDLTCPKCGKGQMVKKFEGTNCVPDVPGAYDYEHGKKAWKKRMSPDEQSKVLTGERDPY